MLLFLLLFSLSAFSQCPQKIQAFSGAETINYNLYFNWQFIWIKAGTATMSTTPTDYRGQSAYTTSLVTKSSQKVDKYFMMRDTIMSIFSNKLVPLYYRKGAREGKRYYVDEMWYSYPDGKCQTTTRHLHNDGTRTAEKHLYNQCMTDMLHAFQCVRNMDATTWMKGHTENLSIAGGSEITKARLVYREKKKIKGDDGKTYQCLVLSYIEKEDKKDKEIVRFYVTDDKRHIPIRLDLNLRFGSAKAFLSSVK